MHYENSEEESIVRVRGGRSCLVKLETNHGAEMLPLLEQGTANPSALRAVSTGSSDCNVLWRKALRLGRQQSVLAGRLPLSPFFGG